MHELNNHAILEISFMMTKVAHIRNLHPKFITQQIRLFSIHLKTTMDNWTANKLIKDIHNKLIEQRYDSKMQSSTILKQQKESISEIFNIYHQINDPAVIRIMWDWGPCIG